MSEIDADRKNIGLLSSDFVDTIESGYFVDKSLLLKDMIDMRSKVTLITRPRRFGKSINLSMIQTFCEKTESDNSVYFKNLKIWECGEKYGEFLPAVVFEYERCDDVKDLAARALAGRKQIDEKEYDVKLKALAFWTYINSALHSAVFTSW